MIKRTSSAGPAGPIFYTALAAALVGFGLFFDHAATLAPDTGGTGSMVQGELTRERPSPEVEQLARWAVDSRDHGGLPFVVVDKANAWLFTFDANGRLLASTPVLLGANRGDAPAVAATTPAGRFVAATGLPAAGDGIVWTNAVAALSLHRIPPGLSPGRVLQRLASDDAADRRVSDGSLQVPGQFLRDYLGALRGHAVVAYVLPEVMPVRELFSSRAAGSRFSFAHSPRSQAAYRRPS